MTVHRQVCDCGETVTLEADHWLEPSWVTMRGEITECCPMCGKALEDPAVVWADLARAGIA